jgi:hypothetical protein
VVEDEEVKSWTSWYWAVWLFVAVGVAFGVPEAISLLDNDPSTQPLTDWTAARGLGELAMAVGLWLGFHFAIRMIRRKRG